METGEGGFICCYDMLQKTDANEGLSPAAAGVVRPYAGKDTKLNLFRRGFSLLLTAAIFLCQIPEAQAETTETVLTSIGHRDTDTATLSGAGRDVALTVPYSYQGERVDLSNGLKIDYNRDLYQSVVASPASEAVIGQYPVDVTVTFNRAGDGPDAEKDSTVYHVRVVRADAVPAEFSGIIRKTGFSPGTVSFSASDFTAKYSQNDGASLGFISVSGSNLTVGKLQLSGSDYEFGTLLSVSQLSELKFAAASGGTASYDVTAYAGQDTSTPVGTAVLTITVSSLSAPTVTGEISESVSAGSTLFFSLSAFTDNCDLNGGALNTIEIKPTSSGHGTWYAGTAPFTGTKTFDASQIDTLSFTGTSPGTATFQWRVKNEAGFSGSGEGTITVSSASLTLSSYRASSVMRGGTLTISASHFPYSPAAASITYIKISTIPDASDGYLYLTAALSKNDTAGYPAISANKALSAGAVVPYDSLKNLRLSTKSTGSGSEISFTWTATSDAAVKTAIWADPASFTARFVSAGSIYYETDLNIPVTLDPSDFAEEFSDETGNTLSYVTFTLPDAAYGKLYESYSIADGKGKSVSSSTKYYKGTSPSISSVSFVPAAGFTGVVDIAYSAYTAEGDRTAGNLSVTVLETPGGTVSYGADKNSSVQFDAADFASAFLDASGEDLSYVRFTLPSSTYGRLYYDYTSSLSYDSTVSSSKRYYVYSSPYLSYVTFVPREDYTGTVSITYTGYTSDGDSYKGKVKIFVEDSPGGIVSYSINKNGAVSLSGDDFADEFISVTGSALSYVKFTLPKSGGGTLYSDYSDETGKGTKASASTSYYNGSTPDISSLTYVPAADYTGMVTISYTGFTKAGASYAGKLKISVGEVTAGSLTYKTDANEPFLLKTTDFFDEFYKNTSSPLSYVMFTLPSSSYGRLYYGYVSSSNTGSPVSETARYYFNASPYLNNITFVPNTGYTGSFTVTYTAYAASGASYTGKIKIAVGGDEVGTVNYDTNMNTKVTFDASDFSEALSSETDETLYYVKFKIPGSSYGKLYYNYTSASNYSSQVSASTKYYRSSSPGLSRVTFVPAEDFSGTATINYTAYDYDGDSYSGTVVVTVGTGVGGTVNYETDMNTYVTLDEDDFIAAFEDETDSELYYVRFTLPSSTYGTLYYDYTSSSNYDSKVSSSTKYYADSSPYLANISFVPKTDYSGTVTIRYTGYDEGGDSFAGTLVIDVASKNAGTLSLITDRDVPLTLDADDFNSLFLKNTGSTLSYVTFTPPSTSVGRLYYGYRSTSEYGTRVSSGTKYYRNGSPMLSDVTFIPASDFTGTATIAYTGYTSSGTAYKGELLVTVQDSRPFGDMQDAYSWAGDAVLYLYRAGVVNGTGDGRFSPQRSVSRGDFILMVCRAFNFGADTSDSFPDVPPQSYYHDAIASAKALGIASGSNGNFRPSAAISRQDAMVILSRALTAAGKSLGAGNAGDLDSYSDRSMVSGYAEEAVASLVKAGVIQGSNGALHPTSSITRAEMATILYRVLTIE